MDMTPSPNGLQVYLFHFLALNADVETGYRGRAVFVAFLYQFYGRAKFLTLDIAPCLSQAVAPVMTSQIDAVRPLLNNTVEASDGQRFPLLRQKQRGRVLQMFRPLAQV